MLDMKKYLLPLLCVAALLIFSCCKDDEAPDDDDPTGCSPATGSLTDIVYEPVAYNFITPALFPPANLPPGNPLTNEGVELGRRLFYDPLLSADSTMSCASCHNPASSFNDNVAFPIGIDGNAGPRSTMTLLNMAFVPNNEFNWDGKSASLTEQAIEPVINELELHEDWENVECKLRNHTMYPELFRKAFGISDKRDITRELAAKALAQFELTLVSSNSKFDRVIRAEPGQFFEENEQRGWKLFQAEGTEPGIDDAQCWHCHSAGQYKNIFTNGGFFNNGLDSVPNLSDFTDLGRGGVTGNIADNGKFKSPSLRNVALTAPYMHDGRFNTLEEVMNAYGSGGHPAPNVDAFVPLIQLDSAEKADIIALLHTLTDTTFTKNPAYQNPF